MLTIDFTDGETVAGTVRTGRAIVALAYGGRKVPGAVVDGPWAEAISARARRPLTLIHSPVGRRLRRPDHADRRHVDRSGRRVLGITVSDLAKRRFKMSSSSPAPEAYEEDAWRGRDLRDRRGPRSRRRPGAALRPDDARSRHARRDYPVLQAILAHRTPMAGGEPPLGVYATVVEPGVVRVGDAVGPA